MTDLAQQSVIKFDLDLKDCAAKLQIGFSDFMRKVVFDLDRAIVTRTPRDKGTAAGNWIASQGSESPPEIVDPLYQGSGGAPDAKALESVHGLSFSMPYDIYVIANFIVYIGVLEFGGYPGDGPKTVGGFSRQAPAGMVRVAVADLESRIEADMEAALRAKGF